jgi:hypothetical protein
MIGPASFRADRMQPELELGDDPEVSGAAAQPPEQVGVLAVAGCEDVAARRDDIGRDQLIDGEPVLAHQPADAAAQRQTGEPGVRDDAGRYGQPERLRLAVELAEANPGLRPDRAAREVDSYPVHQREVDDHAAVADGQAGEAVSAAAHGRRQAGSTGEPDGLDHVGYPCATCDDGREAVDRAVPHRAVHLVRGIGGEDQLAPEPGGELS